MHLMSLSLYLSTPLPCLLCPYAHPCPPCTSWPPLHYARSCPPRTSWPPSLTQKERVNAEPTEAALERDVGLLFSAGGSSAPQPRWVLRPSAQVGPPPLSPGESSAPQPRWVLRPSAQGPCQGHSMPGAPVPCPAWPARPGLPGRACLGSLG